jgi:hypothetical protein
MIARRLALFIALVLAGSGMLSAQPSAGFPPFASFSGGSGESVDNANLNIHLSLPVFSRAGRALPFGFTLSFDSSIWSPTSATGASAWTPAGSFGWTGITQTVAGYLNYQTTQNGCPYGSGPPFQFYYWHSYSGFAYIDPGGTSHSFPGLSLSDWQTGAPCGGGSPSNGTAQTTDGSGYSVSASAGSGGVTSTVTDAAGTIYYPPSLQGGGWGKVQDSNGNYVTANANGSTTTFTDTLGTTALTATQGTSTWTLTYVGPNGSNSMFATTIYYSNYTVQTNFGCPGVAEYGPTPVYLVGRVDLSDGTSYYFNYEPTPGHPSNVTGRIASIRLPSGSYLTYT